MLKKSITYTDFNGEEATEEFYFHLSKAELVEMQMSHKGGLEQRLKEIVASEDGAAIIAEFKKLILQAYGRKSPDGRSFEKSDQMRMEFQSTEAYSELFMELCTDAKKAAEFVNGIVPHNLEQDMAKIVQAQAQPEADPTAVEPTDIGPRPAVSQKEKTRVLTQEEVAAMDSDELKSGLATGKYKLS